MRTITHKTIIKWKWQDRTGKVVSYFEAFGKPRRTVYFNGIAVIIIMQKRYNKFPHSDGWIYFIVNNKEYKTPIN